MYEGQNQKKGSAPDTEPTGKTDRSDKKQVEYLRLVYAMAGNSLPSSREVLLVFPGRYGSPYPHTPLALLYLAASLLQQGYKARILDMRVERAKHFKLGNPLFVGISCMSGYQIAFGLDFAKSVREADPQCPIVWGGVHPSILPQQTISNEYVDIVAKGEGEQTVVALADKISHGRDLIDMKGIVYKDKGGIRDTPGNELIDLDSMPLDLPYELLKIEKYPTLKSGRIHIQTSRGCPHRCGFCYNIVFNKCKWRGKSPKRVLDEMEHLIWKFGKVTCFDIIDDNYFVDKRRVEAICNGMVSRGIDVPWRADCRFDYMSGYEKDFITLLEKSRCMELNFGAETGSDRLLKAIKKDITPGQMIISLKKLKDWSPTISPYIFWMSGFPTESRKDLDETFGLMDNLSDINPRTQHIEIGIYTPYPSPMFDQLFSEYKLPKTLEEWGQEDIFHFRPPWHSKEYGDLLEGVSIVTKYAFFPEERIRELDVFDRLGYKILNKIARYRWSHRNFNHPLELKIVSEATKRIRGY